MVETDVSDAALDALHEGGFRAIQLNFVRHLAQRPTLPDADRIIGRVAERGWHVELHMDAPDIPELEPWIATLRGRFVTDHIGRVPAAEDLRQPPFQAVLRLLERPNAWAKISGGDRLSAGVPFRDAVPFAQALLRQAPDRLVWGTDWPHSNIRTAMPNDGALADLLSEYAEEPAVGRVLVDNPITLYWRWPGWRVPQRDGPNPRMRRAPAASATSPPRVSMMPAALATSAALSGASTPLRM
jgi:predicted TIM-barrel fold metal-dependent hydrolase